MTPRREQCSTRSCLPLSPLSPLSLVQEEWEGGISSPGFAKVGLQLPSWVSSQHPPFSCFGFLTDPNTLLAEGCCCFQAFASGFVSTPTFPYSAANGCPVQRKARASCPLTPAPQSSPLQIGLGCHFPESKCQS